MSGADPVAAPGLLGRDHWLVLSHPLPGVTPGAVAEVVDEHVTWLLELEAAGRVVLSGPLLDGPGVGPGSGVTVLRADDADDAARLAGGDPFVRAGLRRSEVFRWRVNEGSVGITVSLGTGRFHWS